MKLNFPPFLVRVPDVPCRSNHDELAMAQSSAENASAGERLFGELDEKLAAVATAAKIF